MPNEKSTDLTKLISFQTAKIDFLQSKLLSVKSGAFVSADFSGDFSFDIGRTYAEWFSQLAAKANEDIAAEFVKKIEEETEELNRLIAQHAAEYGNDNN